MDIGTLIVVSAPSGGGKSTLIQRLQWRMKGLLYSVSVTTRPPRKGEKNGKDYIFVSEKEFEKKRKSDQFIEYAKVHGYWYGTPKSFIEKQLRHGQSIVLDIDVQGGKQVKKMFPDCLLIFVAPPSLHVLESRLRGRRKDDEKTIQKRLNDAYDEFRSAQDYDYLVLNDKIEQAVDQLESVIVAEQLSMRHHRSFLNRIAQSSTRK